MYKNYEWWLCHKYDVNYMIMQSNMTTMVHGNISRNGYGNAIIGRYGDCFEEGYMVGVMHRRKLRGTREASNGGRVRVRIFHGLTLVIKNSHTCCKSFISFRS